MDGTPFGRYRLLELLGRGGMGEVWRAFDTDTKRIIALKVLPASFASDPTFAERFRREAYAAASLNDPHVVPIHHFGDIDGRLYLDMRLVDGRDLAEVLEEGPLEPARAVSIVEQVAAALTAAHRIGLVHRDVKPSNVLIAENDFAYLIDFGIARAADETSLTNSGLAIGTADYMAPERLNAELGEADHRVDVYALACILYQCLTGERPFRGSGFAQIATAQLFTPPPRPSTQLASVPIAMDAVISTGMAKDPAARFNSTGELALAARDALAIDRPWAPPTEVAPSPPRPSPPSPPPPSPPPQPPTSNAPMYQGIPWPVLSEVPAKPSRRKPILIGIAALVVVVVVGATAIVLLTRSTDSGSSAGAGSWREPAVTSAVDLPAFLKSAAANTGALKSAHTDMSVAGTIPGFPIQKLDGDVTSTPAAGQGTMDMLFAGSALKDIGYVVVDGTFFAALTPGTWTDFGPAADIFDMTAFLSPSSGLGPVLTTFADPKLAGQESINGVTTTRVDGQVSPSAVNALFPAVKATAPVPATAWIDPATQRLVQLELTPMSGSSIRVTMSNWDKPVTITKPAA